MVTTRRAGALSAEAEAFYAAQPANTSRTDAALRAILAGRHELVQPVLAGEPYPTVSVLARLINYTNYEEDPKPLVVFDLHGAPKEPSTTYSVHIGRSNTVLRNGTLDFRATKAALTIGSFAFDVVLQRMEVLGGEYRCVGVEAEVLGEIQGQRVRLEDCDLHSGRGRGLQVMGERTTVVAVGCRMRNNRAAGVSVRYGGQAELIGCELTGNGNHGEFKAVMIHDPGSKLVLQGCTVAGEGVEPPRAEGGAELTIKAADGRVLLYEKAPYVTDKKYEKSMYGVLL